MPAINRRIAGWQAMKQMKTNCARMDEKLADLAARSLVLRLPRFKRMLRSVSDCQAELDELKATMQLLDAWEAPEPSPYFLTRLGARMREEREAAPAGWLAGTIARMRASIAYGPGLARASSGCDGVDRRAARGRRRLSRRYGLDAARAAQPVRRRPWCTICNTR